MFLFLVNQRLSNSCLSYFVFTFRLQLPNEKLVIEVFTTVEAAYSWEKIAKNLLHEGGCIYEFKDLIRFFHWIILFSETVMILLIAICTFLLFFICMEYVCLCLFLFLGRPMTSVQLCQLFPVSRIAYQVPSHG